MKILISGDFCPRYRVQNLIDEGKVSEVLSQVKQITQTADYSIVNFECPVVIQEAEPIAKQGPNLKTNVSGLEAVGYAGFNCVALANNHFYDYGENGVKDTLESLHKLGIDCCGGGVNIDEASEILYKDINGKTLAIINCCEHEFSIATEKKGGSNPLNPIKQFYDIQKAKQHADFVLMIVHGGHEFYQLPSIRMQETYRFFIDAGADAIINHHQHCFSGYEYYHGKPIFYGLGNLCFDQDPIIADETWNYGYMVTLLLTDTTIQSEIVPYKQCGEKAEVTLLPQNALDEKLEELNTIIADEKALRKAMEDYYEQTSVAMGHSLLEPIQNRFFNAARKRNLLPSFISMKAKLRAENFICCESHRDKLIYFLNNK